MAYQQNAQAMTARESWLNAFALPQALGAEPLAAGPAGRAAAEEPGARNLIALGLDADILAAAQIDRFEHRAPAGSPDVSDQEGMRKWVRGQP